jgi:hypothetical protein
LERNQNAIALNLQRFPAGLNHGLPLNFQNMPPASWTAKGHHGCAGQYGRIMKAEPLNLSRSAAASLNRGNILGQGGATTLSAGAGGSSRRQRCR